MSSFCHLHVHSDYSFLNATSKPHDIVAFAKEQQMERIALTDNGNLFGAVEFYLAGRAAGIVPIIGCDVYHTSSSRHTKQRGESVVTSRMVLLAANSTGYRNLKILSSKGYTEGFYYNPRIDDELLEQYHEGLIALCGGTRGDIALHCSQNRHPEARQRCEYYLKLFGSEHFYIELQNHLTNEELQLNRELASIANEKGVGLVATNNTYYNTMTDAHNHNIHMCIGSRNKVHERGMIFPSEQFYLKTADEMAQVFTDFPQALANSVAIANRCNVDIKIYDTPELPVFSVPATYPTPRAYLEKLAFNGLQERYPDTHAQPELQQRLTYEIDTIDGMGFIGYMLIVWDLVRFAEEHGIPVGPGRGSVVGSLCAYCLHITNIDPLRFNLIFERFLNPERVTMPDIDMDFCVERRGEIIKYIEQTYGQDRVCQIITFGTLKARAVVRDVSRVLAVPLNEVDEICKNIEMMTTQSLSEQLQHNAILQQFRDRGGVYQQLFDASAALEGLKRHPSIHAAGVVIGKNILEEYTPVFRDPKHKTIATQYSGEYLEQCGIIKIDILGLKTLTLLQLCEEQIKQHQPDFNIRTIPDNDKYTFEMLTKGQSLAVFQFENEGMREVLKRARPSRLEDLIALTSLYRPGPMEQIEKYIRIKHGKEKPNYPLQVLEEILQDTYGIIVYQEQVMEIVRKIAGLSFGQADLMRRAMGKKKEKDMQEVKEQFIKGAEINGIDPKLAQKTFDQIAPFVGYGFNKSHAAAYAWLAYQTAYLKARFPAEFMAANLTYEINHPDKLSQYIQETNAMNITILSPSINNSSAGFVVQDGAIIFGLNGIKTLGDKAVQEVLRARDEHGSFSDMLDFLNAVDKSVVTKSSLEAMIRSGVFDEIESDRGMLLANYEYYHAMSRELTNQADINQSGLFGDDEIVSLNERPAIIISKAEMAADEKKYLGNYFSNHPIDEFEHIINRGNFTPISRLATLQNTVASIFGIVQSINVRMLRNNSSIGVFIVLEDTTGSIEIAKFIRNNQQSLEQVMRAYPQSLVGHGVALKVEKTDKTKFIMMLSMNTAHNIEKNLVPSLHVQIQHNVDIEQQLAHIREQILESPGRSPVYFHILHPHQSTNSHSSHHQHNETIANTTTQHTESHPQTILNADVSYNVEVTSELINQIQQQESVVKVWKE